jgi:DNA-binding CsgD family transcriptional regulator
MDTAEKAVATNVRVVPNKPGWAEPSHISHIEKLSPAVVSAERLAAVQRTELLDTLPELEFDRVTRLACRLLGTEVALLSLIDADRQFFKSSCGLPEPWASARQTPLSHSFCQHVVASENYLVIEDARTEPLVADNPAVFELGVIAYLGVPVLAPNGRILGSFCAIAPKPRAWSKDDIALMQDLSGIVESEIALRENARRILTLAQDNALLAREHHRRVKNTLSKRHMEVLRLLGEGKTNKDIAKALCRSPNTIKLHVSAILRLLKLKSRTQAALFASSVYKENGGSRSGGIRSRKKTGTPVTRSKVRARKSPPLNHMIVSDLSLRSMAEAPHSETAE